MKNLLLISTLACVALASVFSLNPDTFDEHVGGSKAVLVKFFAPWCGHCKHLAPEYEKVAEVFDKSPKVLIAEVDCDAHGALCSRFGVQGYPTVKYFPKGEKTGKDYEGGRTFDDIAKYVEEQGIRRSGSKSNVVSLNKNNFEKVALDSNKDVLVKFFAPWCGHCKALAPAFESVSAAYAAEESVIIAEVNCDAAENKELCSKYEVTGFPTLKWFPKGNKAGTPYTGGRDAQAFVDFLNSNLNLNRLANGRLSEKAGRVDALDAIAAKFVKATDKGELMAQSRIAAEAQVGNAAKHAKLYIKLMESITEKGEEFIAKEKARLQGYVDGGQISPKKADDFTIRLNILNMF